MYVYISYRCIIDEIKKKKEKIFKNDERKNKS